MLVLLPVWALEVVGGFVAEESQYFEEEFEEDEEEHVFVGFGAQKRGDVLDEGVAVLHELELGNQQLVVG